MLKLIMSGKKPKGSRKDPSKTPKAWERARREKMKIFFNELQEVLPFYDPSSPMSRFEILQKSKSYIKDLQDQNQELLNGGFDEVYKMKMIKLKQRVKELLKRVDQLTDLLRTANIMIPPAEAWPEGVKTPNGFKWMNQRPKKWTEKINLVVPDDKVKSVLTLIKDYKKNAIKAANKKKQGNEKTDTETCVQKPIRKKLKKTSKVINLKTNKNNYEKSELSGSQSPSQYKENQPVDFNLISNESAKSTESRKSTTTECISTSVNKITIPQKLIEAQNVILPPPQNMLQSNTYILTNDGSLVQLPILNSSGPVFNTNSNLLTPATIVKPSAGLITPLVINKPPPVIVLQKPPTQIIQAAQIINTAPQVISVSQPGIQILGGSVVYTSSNSITKTLPHILSKAPANKKRIERDSTVTTYVNKIPIPALSKQSYAKKGVSAVSTKEKVKTKEVEKSTEEEKKGGKVEKEPGEVQENESAEKGTTVGQTVAQKRDLEEEKTNNPKKQKLDKETTENVFKPIESDGMFCSLALPNAINPSLSVSPTAAFLSSFPIVAPSRAEDEINERKDEAKEKPSDLKSSEIQTKESEVLPEPTIQKLTESSKENKLPLDPITKPWEQFHSETCEIRPENFYLQPDNIQLNSTLEVPSAPAITFPITNNMNTSYTTYPQNNIKPNDIGVQSLDHSFKNNQFEYHQKDYVNKITNDRQLKKQCDSYIPKTQASYQPDQIGNQVDSQPTYQLIPAKETPNQRNSRTVNWMTEPDVRGLVYTSQSDKITTKAPVYTQSDHFYASNQNLKMPDQNFITDQNKVSYQKNEFYVKDQRCKTADKRIDKCYPKTQNYNIFDYNYASCYMEDDTKYCNVQYPGKGKKNLNQKKKAEEEEKRMQDPIITNLDFNPVANQECFSWMPGKNVDWLPSKSFGLDTNLVVPSTLPTLVGDLALGTTTTNDVSQTKTTPRKSNDINSVDLGMGTNSLPKPMETDSSKQYLEPFANLSKNIFDVSSNVHNQMPKNDFDKISFNASNETIVLKNIFELPVSKNSTEFPRNKQRAANTTQNTFLSVSQLVEPPAFEQATIKNDNQIESTKDLYSQNYPNYNNHKTYKNKSRNSHCKYNDRKYHGYKNTSSSYTAEALIRSNTNINYQTEFPAENTNFFNGKANQKTEQFPSNSKIDFELNMAGPSQNIYSDFNFSSPVPNFSIGAVGTDFGNHETQNFSSQNNFFGDFITPEYPLTENVSNSLLLPPCSIALQNPFVIDKRNAPEKTKTKQYSRNRKHYDCSKSSFNDFTIPSTSTIFTTSSLSCPTIFTTSAPQNLLPVPTQSIPISFSSPSFTTSNISFPPLSTNSNSSYHKFNASQNSSTSFLSSNSFTTCTTKPLPSSHNCYSSNPLTTVTTSVISSFPNVPFSASSQSSISFFSLSNPIIPSSAPTSSSNSLANFNLSTIFPEINQKGNYHYS